MTPDDFRRLALSLPDTAEGAHHGHADFRVQGKIFATLAYQQEGFGVLLFTPEEQQGAVADAPHIFSPVPGGWGRQGSTRVLLAEATEEILAGALRTAWKIRSPKPKPARARKRPA